MNQEKIGSIIKKIRKDNNLTQKEFASIYNVTYQAVSKWENGINIPDINIIKDICNDYNIDINDLLNGTNKKRTNFKLILSIVTIVIIILIISIILIFNNKDNINLKTITSNCDDFDVSGVIAYNSDNSSIYISNINYCNEKDTIKYDKVTCILYENHNKKNIKIYSYKKNNISLKEFLNNIDFHVNNYKTSCNYINKDEFYLVIKTTLNNKTISYKIPLTLEDNCK